MQRREPINDELLSAYLDGQLSPEERAEVDARLASDSDARDLVRELRAAAEAIRELPRVAAPRDLKAAILRAAEQVDRTKPGGTTPVVASAGSGSAWPIGRSRRGWFWAGLAVAAALMIMFLDRGGQPPKNLAQRGEQRGASRPRTAPRLSVPRDAALDDALDLARSMERDAKSSGDEAEIRLRSDLGDIAGGAGGVPLAADANAARSLDEMSRISETERLSEPTGDRENQSTNGQADSHDRYFKQLGDQPAGREELGVVISNTEAAFIEPVTAAPADVPVYFVSVNVTPEAVRSKAIANTLGRNSIVLVDEANTALFSRAQILEESAPAEQEPAREQLLKLRSAESRAPGQKEQSASEVVAVEALPEQVVGFLSDMAADPRSFTAVAVLAEQDAAQGESIIEDAAQYSRNADDALRQVAGNWRFVPDGAGESVRVEKTEQSPQQPLAAGGFGAAFGAEPRELRQRLADRSEADRFGESAGDDPGGTIAEAQAAQGQGGIAGAPTDDQALAEVETNREPAAAPDAYSRAPFYSLAEEAIVQADAPVVDGLPPEPADDQAPSTEQFARGTAESKMASSSAGKAWVVSPLQVRSLAIAQEAQPLARNFGMAPAAQAPAQLQAQTMQAPTTPGLRPAPAQLPVAAGMEGTASGARQPIRVVLFFNLLSSEVAEAEAVAPSASDSEPAAPAGPAE